MPSSRSGVVKLYSDIKSSFREFLSNKFSKFIILESPHFISIYLLEESELPCYSDTLSKLRCFLEKNFTVKMDDSDLDIAKSFYNFFFFPA